MAQHEIKQCPRCNKNFECKCGSINICQCTQVNLPGNLSEQLKLHFEDCLCISCLRELRLSSDKDLDKKNSLDAMNNLISMR